MVRRVLPVLALLALGSCAKPNNPVGRDAVMDVSAHSYPSDPEAAGWEQPAPLFNSSPNQLISEINRKQEADFANESDLEAVPLEQLNSSESIAKDVLSNNRTASDRSHDRDENDVLELETAPGELETDAEFANRKGPKPQTPNPTPKSWETLLPPAMTRGIEYGTSIAGPQPYSRKDTTPFVPASIVKALSVSRALEILGRDYRFETRFTWNDLGGGIATRFTITANGDPTVGSSDFGDGDLRRLKASIQEIKAAGVKEVRGPIRTVSEDSRWDKSIQAPGIEARDYLACYGALSTAFNVGGNCAVAAIRSSTSGSWQMPEITVPISVNLTLGKSTAVSVQPVLDASGHITGYSAKGTWGKGRKEPVLVRLPVPNSKDRMKNIVARELRAAGIAYSPSENEPQGGAQKQIVMYSPPLSEIIVPLLKESDNFLADALFKRAGSEWPNRSLPLREAAQLQLAKGIELWTAKAGFTHMKDELLLLDGAGLSRANRATARAYLAAMKSISQQAYFTAVWNGLPIAGIDGTLISRLKSPRTRGMIRAKTGTVRGAYQLTGYVPDYEADASIKEQVPFVILTSTTPGNAARVFSIQERLLVRLSEIVNPSFNPPRIPMP